MNQRASIERAWEDAAAEARIHKAQARAHRAAAQQAATRRDKLRKELAALGLGLVEASSP
jgi:hypothetical protein